MYKVAIKEISATKTPFDLFTEGTYFYKENENFYLSIYIFYVLFTSSFISHTRSPDGSFKINEKTTFMQQL